MKRERVSKVPIEITEVPIGSLKPADYNPRKWNDDMKENRAKARGSPRCSTWIGTWVYLHVYMWLGRRDSNPRMTAPEAVALPLGDSPTRWLNQCK